MKFVFSEAGLAILYIAIGTIYVGVLLFFAKGIGIL